MNSGGSIASIIVDLDRSIKLISVCVVIITVSTMLYVWVLKWIAKPLLYTSLSLILLGLIAGGALLWRWIHVHQGGRLPCDLRVI